MDDFSVGHGDGFGIDGVGQILHHPLFHLGGGGGVVGRKGFERAVLVVGHVIKGRNVNPFQLRQVPQNVDARKASFPPVPDHVDQFVHHVLAVADHKGVDEGCQGLGVKGAGAARHHDGVLFGPVLPTDGHPAQVQHLQDVGIAHFVLQGEADNVKFVQRRPAFQRKQRHPGFPHLVRHVGVGHEQALAKGVLPLVDEIIQYFHAKVAHADFIGVGKAEAKGAAHAVPILAHGVHFPAGIARGALNRFQQLFQLPVFQVVQRSFPPNKNPYKAKLQYSIFRSVCPCFQRKNESGFHD